ncbi:MAG: ATP-binding cassette domain-containing protein [Gammaproteobacteria bacterium]|nr:ATP-binding cassette domain-containing protein [Gammaproteobacteria bacterium]NIP88095.1 ATP-binding cassette domain-containing protein [Gammaproteobacteria bacterium]NIR22605.1 ATP-binding cassette domain-containing protein [Gammaproteobacteria bacterium]NIS04504.1 ATP-binding cassette domain-containing protein [Gammaproteobacteria bacterium]NIU42462.1 ATP-binding cassette domain-containing protein [Gammaproteobacteria bacterium]
MLRLDKVDLWRGGRCVLRAVDLTIHAGDKVGITGRNGAGKSTLLQVVAGNLHADAGSVSLAKGTRIAQVAQAPAVTDRAAIEHVIDGDTELRRLQSELTAAEHAGDGHGQALIHGRLADIGAYAAPARAAEIMAGLGFAEADASLPLASFSGGWRMRLHLAQALIGRSDLLLLDEPTNHLDLDAVIWLESWLGGYQGTLLLISHDREFIDPLVSHIAHVEGARVCVYSGNYSAFEAQRATELAEREANRRKQQREIAHMRRFVERFRYKASKARQAQSRLKALERMELIAPAHVDSPFHFDFAAPKDPPTPLLRLEAASAGYGAHAVLDNVAVALAPGDRVALLGANGAGKSTLMKTLAGELEPLAGKRIPAARLTIGYFAQHRIEQLDASLSPLAQLRRMDSGSDEQRLRDFLGGFGFAGERVEEPVARLSGGEQARLALALILFGRPNLLLLDEPTNHLDLEMRLALNVALQAFAGAVVLVSHDRHLLRSVVDDLYLVAGRRVTRYEGDLHDYADWLARRRRTPRACAAHESPVAPPSGRARRQAEARKRARLKPLRDELERLEGELEALAAQRSALQASLADASVYQPQARDRLEALLIDRGRVERCLEQTEALWLAASERLERAVQEAGGER